MTPPEIIFNEVSLSTHTFQNHVTAQSCFEEFIASLGKLITDELAKPVLRSQLCLQDAAIPTSTEGNWLVSKWLFNKNIDRDRRNFVLTLATKIPIENGLGLNQDQEDELLKYEFRASQVNGPDVYALGVALQTNHIVASLPSDQIWDTSQLDTYVCENKLVIRKTVIDHVSREKHCDLLAKLYFDKRFDSITNASDFRREKAALFPNLQFSPDVDAQVDKLDTRYLLNALAKLAKMNETVTLWRARGSYEPPEYRFSWRPESHSTMSNPTYRQARTFRIPEGGDGIFESHLDFSDRHRIHFLEDRAALTIIIGYIGDHLPTTKYNT